MGRTLWSRYQISDFDLEFINDDFGVHGQGKIDGAFTAGLVSGVLGSYGISVGNKKSGQNNSNSPKIVDNSKNKVGIK